MPSNTKENGFETLIVNWLVNENGYEQGTNADYNQEYAIDEERLFRYLQKYTATRFSGAAYTRYTGRKEEVSGETQSEAV